jgi:hypothetical protein
MFVYDAGPDRIQFSRRHARPDRVFHGFKHAANHRAGRAHSSEFFGAIDGHSASGQSS